MNTCPVPRCGEQIVNPTASFCRRHWWMLPERHRRNVREAQREGAPEGHLAAVAVATGVLDAQDAQAREVA